MRLSRILDRPEFNVFFSLLLGIGIVAIVRPLCKGNDCVVNKSPPVKEWDGTVYRIGKDCFEFTANTVQCTGKDEIESFKLQNTAPTRESVIKQPSVYGV